MEALNEIRRLRRNANSIKALFNVKIPQWNADSSHYDKTEWAFNGDHRFKACDDISIYFSSLMGTYGDSGCSTQCDLDKDIFKNHFVKYLNKHKKDIMLSIATSIEDEARTLKGKAENELNEAMLKLKELDQ